MHTAEEVQKQLIDVSIRGKAREMLLAYADLLEAMEDFDANPPKYTENPAELIRQRATEKQKARKG